MKARHAVRCYEVLSTKGIYPEKQISETSMNNKENRMELRADSASETENTTVKTSAKVASESVADEPQVATYEPRFKSFSGQPDRFLPAAKAHRDVSEFVLEDKEAGREHTAGGERYVARPSFLTGLQAQLKEAKTAEEAEQLQSAFSMEYILNKARDFFATTASKFGIDHTASPADNRPIDTAIATIGHQILEIDPATGHKVVRIGRKTYDANSVIADADTDDVLAQAFGDKQTALAKIAAPEGTVRNADLDFAWKSWFGFGDLPKTTAPPEIFVVSAHGAPGKVLRQTAGVALSIDAEIPYSEFESAVAKAFAQHRKRYPMAPPLILLAVCDGSVPPKEGQSLAAKLAADEGVMVLGAPSLVFQENGQIWEGKHDGKTGEPIYTPNGYQLISPAGSVVDTMKQPITDAEWKRVERISRSGKKHVRRGTQQ